MYSSVCYHHIDQVRDADGGSPMESWCEPSPPMACVCVDVVSGSLRASPSHTRAGARHSVRSILLLPLISVQRCAEIVVEDEGVAVENTGGLVCVFKAPKGGVQVEGKQAVDVVKAAGGKSTSQLRDQISAHLKFQVRVFYV